MVRIWRFSIIDVEATQYVFVLSSAAKFLEVLGHKENDLYAITLEVDWRIHEAREQS